MIAHFPPDLPVAEQERLCRTYEGIGFPTLEAWVLVTPGSHVNLSVEDAQRALNQWVTGDDIQLSSRQYLPETRRIELPNGVVFGGDAKQTVVMTGPCAVESEAQLRHLAELCIATGVRVLRAGAFKPRTSPYSFQGLGLAGLELLAQMRAEYGLAIITEVKDATHVAAVLEYADVVQVGAKAMYDHGILRACGESTKPVLIKRGFGSTIAELARAAEFVLSGGNPNVMVCERGIRTFETASRFTLDLAGTVWIKHHLNLPVVLDPSHAMGKRYGVPDLARACVALGIDGLLVETHPTPDAALSDPAQQLTPQMFVELHASLKPVAQAVGYTLV